MANALYGKFKESLLSQSPSVDLDTDTIKIALVRSYTANMSTHQYLSDVTGGGGGTIVGTAQTLASKTVTAGVFDAADVTFTAVTAGAACNHLVIYKDTGTPSTSPLIAALDTGTGLPFTPNGGDLQIAFDSGSSKIFAL